MKKILVVLLSLGLLVAFGATASAADVKFSGSYYITGLYDDNYTFADTNKKYSRALFYQRLRVQPVIEVAQGLTLTTRFDAMETVLGHTDWRTGVDAKYSSRRETITTGGNPKIQESFEFERVYVGFATAVGVVQAGIMSSGKWGTDYGDDEQSRPRIRIDGKAGPVNWGFVYEKEFEADISSQTGYAGKADADNDTYALYGIYNFTGGSAGVLYKYFDRRAARVSANNRAKFHALLPYMKATFGPVYIEAEVIKGWGKAAEYDSGGTDIDMNNLGAYAKVRANFGPAYFGAAALFSQGDDNPSDTTLKTSSGSQDLDFGLMLGNDALQTWENTSGNGGANSSAAFDSGKQNSIMYSVFGGFNPTPKLNFEAMLIQAKRHKAPGYVSKDMGIELDVTAKYKLYDNLTYMVGAAYLWAGDYWKGTNSANTVGNGYLLMNRLSLSF